MKIYLNVSKLVCKPMNYTSIIIGNLSYLINRVGFTKLGAQKPLDFHKFLTLIKGFL